MDKIGKYDIVEMLGRGAMGLVFKGFDESLNRHVAIKVMTTTLEIDPDLRERFFREAQAAGSLQHPNVITVFELGESEGKPYIAMEYLPGRDLEDIVKAREPLTVVEKVDIIEQVCRGLSYAHERGVIHRDIKPANIRVTEMGQVKLMDFGVAHLVSSELTATGSLMGTPFYMAPEVVDGKTIDLRADIFSVGATFYELLAYQRPFQGDDLHAVFRKILQTDPPPLEKLGLDVPPMVQQVLDRSLAKRPAERYSNVSQLLSDLMNFWETLPGGPKAARAESTISLGKTAAKAQEAAKRARRRKRILPIGLGAAALVALAIGLWTVFGPEQDAESTQLGQRDPAVELDGGATEPVTPPTEPQDRAGPDQGTAVGEEAGGEPGAGPSETTAPAETATEAQETEPPVTRRPQPRRDTGPSAAERAAARAASAFAALRDSVTATREEAARLNAGALESDAFNRAESALTAANRAADAGRFETAMTNLRQARADYVATWEGAEAIWMARVDSARGQVSGLAARADPTMPEYNRGAEHQEAATDAAGRGEYQEALRQLSLAEASYRQAVRAEQPEPARPPAGPAAPDEIVQATLAELRRAIEAEDLAAVRRVWISLDSRQARSFEAFFDLARDLEVSFDVELTSATDGQIDVTVQATYDYVDSETGRDESATDSRRRFRLAPREGRWVIVQSFD